MRLIERSRFRIDACSVYIRCLKDFLRHQNKGSIRILSQNEQYQPKERNPPSGIPQLVKEQKKTQAPVDMGAGREQPLHETKFTQR
jgi:hypothetical protein